jgi:alkanesulfonate monooxygenase SsuD/methylene tetrahydromethanopterin reductase-like flavin-dependent oxidoreductase (luciferase family)
MKAGVVYPQIELGGDTGAVKAFAQAAEDLGYDHIVIYDHVLGAVHADREPKLTGPYKESDPFHEPLVTYAYLAGITKKLELVTGVIILPQRQTALFAKQAADVDLFSDGRLRLGVGIGWNWVEYDGLEMPQHFRRRGKRQEQQIALIRKLWEETGRPGSGTVSCFQAGLKPRRPKSRRGSRPSCAHSGEMLMHSVSSPFSNTVAATTVGLATLRHGAKQRGATFRL